MPSFYGFLDLGRDYNWLWSIHFSQKNERTWLIGVMSEAKYKGHNIILCVLQVHLRLQSLQCKCIGAL